MITTKKHQIKLFIVAFFSLCFNFTHTVIDYLDTVFGPDANGIVVTNVSDAIGSSSEIHAVTNAGGKVVAAGVTTISDVSNLTLARYSADGTLDTTFNSGGDIPGIVISTAGSSSAMANAVIVDGSSNIVAAGNNGSNDVLVVRYDSDGEPDATFGTAGVATLHVDSSDASQANSIAIDANDKILIGGFAIISGQVYLLVARFNSDGSVDTTFNTVGYNTIRVSFNFIGHSIAIDTNAKIVVAGLAETSTGSDFLIARFNDDGTLDTNFNSGGSTPGIQTTTVTSSAANVGRAVSVDSSNKYVVSGYSDVSGDSTFSLVRYDNNGDLDTTFGPGLTGIVTTTIGTNARIFAAAIDLDDNIIASGSSDNQIATARYSPNGSLDTTFGISGTLVTAEGTDSAALGLTVQTTDGRVVIGGFTIDQTTELPSFVLIRYNKNNTDFVNITSVNDNSIITTKIPTISGTSSAPANSATKVQALANGVSFATVATDGSGNWNAGNTSVLPVGVNYVQANLQDAMSNTIVSHKTKFTVVDNLSEDSVFAYNSTNQTQSLTITITPAFSSALPFNSGNLITPSTWTLSSNVFTCKVAGRYFIEYMGHAGATSLNLITSANVGMAAYFNGTEYVGSEANTNIDLVTGHTQVISKSFIKDFAVDDTISLRFGVNGTGTITLGTITAGLINNTNTTGTQYPYSISITRIG